jgi:LEA14-like dessication related protein
MMMTYFQRSFLIIIMLFSSSCAMMNPTFENPKVKVAGLKMLPTQNIISQPIEITLLVTNPNATDLNLRGISYTVGLDNFELLSGVSNQLPTLTAYQETPVKIVVSLNAIQLIKYISHFNKTGNQDSVKYNFDAKLDFYKFLPALHVKEAGVLPLKK